MQWCALKVLGGFASYLPSIYTYIVTRASFGPDVYAALTSLPTYDQDTYDLVVDNSSFPLDSYNAVTTYPTFNGYVYDTVTLNSSFQTDSYNAVTSNPPFDSYVYDTVVQDSAFQSDSYTAVTSNPPFDSYVYASVVNNIGFENKVFDTYNDNSDYTTQFDSSCQTYISGAYAAVACNASWLNKNDPSGPTTWNPRYVGLARNILLRVGFTVTMGGAGPIIAAVNVNPPPRPIWNYSMVIPISLNGVWIVTTCEVINYTISSVIYVAVRIWRDVAKSGFLINDIVSVSCEPSYIAANDHFS